MANMITKVEKFDAIAKFLADKGITTLPIEGKGDFVVADFITAEIEQTNKRNARKSTSPTKTQKENAEIKTQILDTLANASDGMTASEVAKTLGLNSPQKASALLKQLIDGGKVAKGKVGKATVFTLA